MPAVLTTILRRSKLPKKLVISPHPLLGEPTVIIE